MFQSLTVIMPLIKDILTTLSNFFLLLKRGKNEYGDFKFNQGQSKGNLNIGVFIRISTQSSIGYSKIIFIIRLIVIFLPFGIET